MNSRSIGGAAEGAVQSVTLHDGSIVKLRKVDQDYDATNRDAKLMAQFR